MNNTGRHIWPDPAKLAAAEADVLILWLRNTGRRFGAACGVCGEDLEDLASGFASRMFLQNEALLREKLAYGGDVWVFECARNHARNFLRQLRRHEAHLAPPAFQMSLEEEWAQGTWCTCQDISGEPVFDLVARSECQERVRALICGLPPRQRVLLWRCYVLGQSIEEIAAAVCSTPRGVEQGIYRARKELAQHLQTLGLTLADF